MAEGFLFKHILLPNVYSNGVGSQVITTLVSTLLLHDIYTIAYKHGYIYKC